MFNYFLRSEINNDKNLTADTRKALGFHIEDMLVSCNFNYQPCSTTDFTYLYNPLYGNCFTFNSGAYENGTTYLPKTVSANSKLFGLNLELFLGNPSMDSSFEPSNGIILSILNQTSVPFMQDGVYSSEAQAETNFIINRNFITMLQAPYGNCLPTGSDSTYYNYIVNTLDKSYSQEFCMNLCIQDQIIQTCGCGNIYMPIFNNNSAAFCNNIYSAACSAIVTSNSTITAICANSCPYECNSIDYGTTSFRADYPATSYTNILYNFMLSKGINISLSEVPKAFTKISINYHSMHYTTTTQMIQMQLADLFSNFGGTLGLFLGMSFLTFAEFFEIFFNIALMLFKCCLVRKQKIHSTDSENYFQTSNPV